MWIDNELESPGVVPAADLGVADRMVVTRFPGHEPGEAGAAALHEIEPLVLAKGAMAVGLGGDVEQLGHSGDVASAHLSLDLQMVHRWQGSGDMAKPRSPKGRARETTARLAVEYPGEARELCALRFETPYQLLAATILSAQTTDERVNSVTPGLFLQYPTPVALAAADPIELEALIHPTGFFRAKARSLIGMGDALERRFGGEVPTALEDLVTLPGVGRKTANVVRSVAFGLPGLPVDTHVGRLVRRLDLTQEEDPVKAELALNALVPAADRGRFSLRLILHGRQVCLARKPRCETCVLADICPSSLVPTR